MNFVVLARSKEHQILPLTFERRHAVTAQAVEQKHLPLRIEASRFALGQRSCISLPVVVWSVEKVAACDVAKVLSTLGPAL